MSFSPSYVELFALLYYEVKLYTLWSGLYLFSTHEVGKVQKWSKMKEASNFHYGEIESGLLRKTINTLY